MKEYFWDEIGIGAKNNVKLTPIPGTKKGAVIHRDSNINLFDFKALNWGSMYLDKDGNFGPANRLYYWYTGARFVITDPTNPSTWFDNRTLHTAICYAYSDDYGSTWVRPNLGLVTWNGNTNNNICYLDEVGAGGVSTQIGGVTVRPSEAKSFKYVLMRSPQNEVWESDSLYLFPNATLIRKYDHSTDSTTCAGLSDGKMSIVIQHDWKTGDPTKGNGGTIRWASMEVLTDIANDPWRTQYDSGGGQYVYNGQNSVSNDANMYVDGEAQHHGGATIKDFPDDINGRSLLLGINTFITQAPGGRWDSGLFTVRNFEDGIVTNVTDVKRIGTLTTEKIIQRGTPHLVDITNGAFDGGTVTFISGSLIDLGDTLRAFYTGWLFDYYDAYLPVPEYNCDTTDQRLPGMLEWRKDGLTSIQNQNATAGDVTTVLRTKNVGDLIKLNYTGGLSVELLDGNDQIIPGYSKAECTLPSGDFLNQVATWGSRNASELTQFKMKFYLEG